jgi:coenzyme F420-reducing hydrogenase delta subunit
MAEYGEWTKKGATLSDATAHKEYGVSQDFIVNGIQSGKLEYREGAIWGNPYLRVLKSQLERYIIEELGSNYLASRKNRTELRKVNKEIAEMKKKLAELQARKSEIEKSGAL